MQRQRLLLTLLAFFTLALTGCGQKGDLFLPEDAPSNSFTETQS
ncbi:MAG: lipopeptide [Oceanospirillaceae bacterium]|nr:MULTISPECIES: lipoprotein [unclassified Thalassolituus]MAS26090.1 lipopeptide [Oceanospirillaceae bacterium]MAY01057.1 lipopeptide [Oceanospirillaceae bacterium]MBL36553.1 lipopeptide [Oceanospirillaceae bacterium]MBS53379.1 lipopeptide [Oceanospirillaceae bacterium]|tara:strand:- start:285 stop:416 length:132 start_codon:yes stop_codon:yes gene_type:complete